MTSLERKTEANNENESPVFKTVSQFAEDNPAFTEGGLRHVLFYKGVELEDAGVISRFGRKILINEGRWLRRVEKGFFKKISGGRK